MSVVVPRKELNAIAERYNDAFNLSGDPTVQYVRDCADYYRSATALMGGQRSRENLLAEAAELDALADRYETETA